MHMYFKISQLLARIKVVWFDRMHEKHSGKQVLVPCWGVAMRNVKLELIHNQEATVVLDPPN
jgi:hypothetical protein